MRKFRGNSCADCLCSMFKLFKMFSDLHLTILIHLLADESPMVSEWIPVGTFTACGSDVQPRHVLCEHNEWLGTLNMTWHVLNGLLLLNCEFPSMCDVHCPHLFCDWALCFRLGSYSHWAIVLKYGWLYTPYAGYHYYERVCVTF